jgi:hypothetical protein
MILSMGRFELTSSEHHQSIVTAKTTMIFLFVVCELPLKYLELTKLGNKWIFLVEKIQYSGLSST